MKTCSKCLEVTDNFYKNQQTNWCKKCFNAYNKKWRDTPERKKHIYEQSLTRYYRKYSMTLDQYDAMFKAQGGVCAACGQPPTNNRLVVDHDHSCCPGKTSCGKCVRALLCTGCNGALGLVKDNPETLARLIDYLGGVANG